MLSGTVFDIIRFAMHDGPGIRSTVFLKGCPLSCWWCHNPESQSPHRQLILRPNLCIGCRACMESCLQGAIRFEDGKIITERIRCSLCEACVDICCSDVREVLGKEMTVQEVMAEIERDRPFYEESGGGVTFSGGEPLFQHEFLIGLLQACRLRGLHTTLDTCGFAPWEWVDRVRPFVDLFLYDLKLMDDTRHRLYTGVSNQLILESLVKLARLGHVLILRVPLIPGVNDDEENLRRMGEFAAGLPGLKRLDLLPYHNHGAEKYPRLGMSYKLPDTTSLTSEGEQITRAAQLLRGAGLVVIAG